MALGNLATGLAAVVAGWAAIRGLNAWRTETVGRRKTELAEEVLAQFYRARDILAWARFPTSGTHASGTHEREPIGTRARKQSDERETRERNAIFAPVDRLTKESQIFSELQASRYRFMAYFGEEAAWPFDEIRAIHDEIVASAEMLVRSYGKESSNADERRRDRWEAAIGWGKPARMILLRAVSRRLSARSSRPVAR